MLLESLTASPSLPGLLGPGFLLGEGGLGWLEVPALGYPGWGGLFLLGGLHCHLPLDLSGVFLSHGCQLLAFLL